MYLKKIFLFTVTLLITLTLASCSNSKSSNQEKNISSLKIENSKLKKQVITLKKYSSKKNKETSSVASSSSSSTNDISTSQSGKSSNLVGIVTYKITSIKSKKVKNKESNYTDTEYNDDNIKEIGDYYYRTAIDYILTNTSNKKFDLSTYSANILDDNNLEYSDSSTYNYLLDDNSRNILQPKTATSGKFILLSKEAPSLNNFTINISKQLQPNGLTIGKSGIIKFK